MKNTNQAGNWPEVTPDDGPEERVKILRETKPNTWIALSADESRVVGRGDTYAEAVAEAGIQGEEDPVVLKTLDDWSPIPIC